MAGVDPRGAPGTCDLGLCPVSSVGERLRATKVLPVLDAHAEGEVVKGRIAVSESEKQLIERARELTKLTTKRADIEERCRKSNVAFAGKLDEVDKAIAAVRGQISTLIAPVIPAAPVAWDSNG